MEKKSQRGNGCTKKATEVRAHTYRHAKERSTKMRVANVASVKDDRKWGKKKDEMASE